jgi:Flp pilus assembly protein TadD
MTRYRSEIIVSLFLIVSTLAVWWQVRHHEFLNFDDNDYITENHHVQAGWTIEGVVWAFTTRFHRHWHPVTWLSHMTDCQFFGLNPGWHHLSSVFFHMVNTLLLFFVFRQMTRAVWRSAFVAALFALHPLHVEPVAWVADRKDVLSTFFWMLTMWVYVRYAERPGFTRYVLVLIGFILGLMAKSMVVTLPLVLLLLDYWPLGRFEFGQSFAGQSIGARKFTDAGRQRIPAFRVVWEKALLFLMIGAFAVVAVLVMHRGRTLGSAMGAFWPRKDLIAGSLVHYISYIGKMFWPLDLATPYPEALMPPGWQVGGAGLLLLCISFLAFWQGRRRPYLAVGWLWYLLTLVPVIGLLRSGPQVIADRYTYVPLIGLSIMIAWSVPDLLAGWRHGRTALVVSAGIVLLVLMMSAWHQVGHWKNSVTLLTHTVNMTADNWLAHNNLGVALKDQGRFEEAISHYAEALRIDPAYAVARSNLGIALAEQGKFEEAIEHFSEALRIQPNYEEAHYNLGLALAKQGNVQEAIRHFSEALRIKPRYEEAHYNLGVALAKQGKLQEAIEHFSEALKIQPDYAKAHHQLCIALARQGRLQEAIHHFSEALKIQPDYAKARHNLNRALRLMGNSTETPNTLVTP